MTPAEFEQLYHRHGRRLFGLAWQLTTSGADAEDAVQETFLRALRALETYEERSRAGAWLDRILVNVVRERGRRRTFFRRSVEPDLKVLAPPEADGTAGPDERLEHSERLQAIQAGLAGIPPTFREVLVLRHFEERSTAEVASLLDLPEGTVRTRLKRARDMLVRAVSDGYGSPREEGS